MERYDFEESIGYWLCTASHVYQSALSQALSAQGITYRQFQVLAWLNLEGDLSQADLADRIGIEASTLVGILDRMTRDGWIERHSVPGDRRRKVIRPTEQVAPVWDKMATCAREIRQLATEGLTPQQLADLKVMLEHIRTNVTKALAAAAASPRIVSSDRLGKRDGNGRADIDAYAARDTSQGS